MTTLLQACKQIVKNSIDLECAEGQSLEEVYLSEYGYNGVSQKACTNYLQGLPSVCTVPFSNFDILQLLATKGIVRKTDNAKIKLVEDYWATCGHAFYQLIK